VITLFVLLYMRVGCDNTVRHVIYEGWLVITANPHIKQDEQCYHSQPSYITGRTVLSQPTLIYNKTNSVITANPHIQQNDKWLAVITLFVLSYMRVDCDNSVRLVIYEG
jgi:hypothetical protein